MNQMVSIMILSKQLHGMTSDHQDHRETATKSQRNYYRNTHLQYAWLHMRVKTQKSIKSLVQVLNIGLKYQTSTIIDCMIPQFWPHTSLLQMVKPMISNLTQSCSKVQNHKTYRLTTQILIKLSFAPVEVVQAGLIQG